ncbi:MAG TPA: class I SAM-dependent methyltransferase, partial [Chitinophagales bacterium]|nr:class I SAM-dependent methyltransferase [Chitinophagales bacterium]
MDICCMAQLDYLSVNLKSWNDSVDIHVNSDFYFVGTFRKGKTSLNSIELELLGDVTGKKILHLQCHFGQDTLSLERLGGITTGVDFSDKAIDTANALKQELGLRSEFIVSDVYNLPEHLFGQFDVVFTTYGALGWLPDMKC